MHQILRLLRQRPGANHAQGQFAHIKYFIAGGLWVDAVIPCQTQVQQAGVRAIVGNQIGARLVLGRVHGLAEAHDDVLRCRLGARVAPELGISPADEAGVPGNRLGQTLRAERALQIARNHAQRHTVGVVAVGAREQIVLQAQGSTSPVQGVLWQAAGNTIRGCGLRATGGSRPEYRARNQRRDTAHRPLRIGLGQPRVKAADAHHDGAPSVALST